MLLQPDPAQPTLRAAEVADAAAMWRLVRDSGALDLNSPYAYLLLCTHQDRTCLVAEEGRRLVGFVTAYVPPRQPETLFVWQVAVAPSHRRRNLGRRLIEGLLDRCPDARFLECTVTPSNRASLGLFRAVAAGRGAGISVRPGFSADDFPSEAPAHEPEDIVRIGPLTNPSSDQPVPYRSATL